MKRNLPDFLIPIVPGVLLATYILIRIFSVSITHDETQTCLTYAPFPILDILTNRNYDPNNHIFHTLMVKFFSALFGIHQWSVRLPNFIGFILFYSSGVAFLKKFILNKWHLLAAIVLIYSNPYLLDFFGLARGYGLSCGIMVCSIYFVAQFITNKRFADLVIALITGILAAYTQFTLLNYFGALVLFLGVYLIFINPGSLKYRVAIVIAIAVLGGLIYVPIKALIVKNTLPHWGDNDLIKDTVFSLVRCLNYNQAVLFIDDAKFLSGILFTGFMGALAVVFVYRKNFRHPGFQLLLLTATLFCGSIIILFLQNKILGTSYLITRTALFLFPLFLLFLVTAIIYLQQIQTGKYSLLIFLLGALAFVHFGRNANTKTTFEWSYNANDKDIIYFLQKKHEAGEATISLNTHWHFHPTLYFYKETMKLDWLNLTTYHKEVQSNNTSTYYFTYSNEASLINSCYSPVDIFGVSERILYKCHP